MTMKQLMMEKVLVMLLSITSVCQGFVLLSPTSTSILSSSFKCKYKYNSKSNPIHQLSMVLEKSKPTESSSSIDGAEDYSSSSAIKTPAPKYPVMRGETVDSRAIISTGARQHLTAIRVKHCLLASEEMATQALWELKQASLAFDALASQISLCEMTREDGGEIGWVSTNEILGTTTTTTTATTEDTASTTSSPSSPNEHLDLILPQQTRWNLVNLKTKPGDVIMLESHRGYHLIQIADVMADVRSMATSIKPRKYHQQQHVKGLNKENIDRVAAIDADINAQTTKQFTYKMETMGCQMNIADSERMAGQLQAMGIRPLNQNDEDNKVKPDLVVLNTCSIRDHAEQKVYSYIGPHAKRKRDGEDVTIVVAGCVAQQEGESLLRRAPEVDLVMGPQYANRLADLLEDVANGNQVVATEAAHIMEDSTKPRRGSKVAAWVNVIYGCNERCTYCIVPTTRGVEQSRPVESIVAEVEELVKQGYKEVTLLGQNIDAYGRDMLPKRKFSDLVKTVGAIKGLDRLRFVTSHPKFMSMGVVDSVAETPTACECFHIPFQSGSDEILAAMGRGHTREKYLMIVDRIRQKIPDAAITADVIVGFPGETEEQFQESLSLMREVVFDSVNTAAYSPRPNTPAAVWENQISEEVKKDRLLRINELNKQHAYERRQRMMGRTVEILVEERNVQNPTQVMGRTRHGFIAYCEGDIDELRGKLINVKIDTCETYYLSGTRA